MKPTLLSVTLRLYNSPAVLSPIRRTSLISPTARTFRNRPSATAIVRRPIFAYALNMNTRDPDPPDLPRKTRLQFNDYVLDLERGCLVLSDNEIALRPKTFAVLRYLVENCGRLVSKEELFRAVWPNVAVTDDTLVQSIGELRRAIRDHGAKIIKTIPRRGYRFEGEVTDATASGKAAVRPALPAAQPDQTLTGPASGRRALRTGLLASCAAMVALLGYVVWPGSPIGTGSGLSSEIISWIRPGIRAPDAVAKPAIAILPF